MPTGATGQPVRLRRQNHGPAQVHVQHLHHRDRGIQTMTDTLTAAGEYAELQWRTFPLTQNPKTPKPQNPK